jgi:hypothetical protein
LRYASTANGKKSSQPPHKYYKAKLDAITKMLLKKMDISQLQQAIAEKDAEQAQVAAFAEREVNRSDNPFLQQEQQIANS